MMRSLVNQVSNGIGKNRLSRLRYTNINEYTLLSKAHISYSQKAIDYLNEFNGNPKQMNSGKISKFWSKDITATEFPNLVSPLGHIRKYDDMLAGMDSAKKVITDQQFKIKSTMTSNENDKLVIVELTWIGTLAFVIYFILFFY